jgi:hypothetical protein
MLVKRARSLSCTTVVARGILSLLICLGAGSAVAQPLEIRKQGTDQAYFAYQGEPLLSFGGLSDFMFWFADDAYDYRLWADWAAARGMNHVRAYPPLSWKHSVLISKANGGSAANVRLPYRVVAGSIVGGDPQFDLLQFDEEYWLRFRERLEYLKAKGIIVHLLMWNNWQLRDADTDKGNDYDWDGHVFNPVNNVDAFTDHLDTSNRTDLFHSVADGRTELADAQRAYFTKLIEETYEFDNVYYDLVHEIAGPHFPSSWSKTQVWIDNMVGAIEARWDQLGAQRPLIIGMDAGGLSATQLNWIFSRPYFNIVIDGKKHTVANARSWQQKYDKPYVPQEAWDDDGTKYYMGSHRQNIRKYFWKFMLARAQQMDLYSWLRNGDPRLFNYDPRGHNDFEDDARVLRTFWESLVDYPNLGFGGSISITTATNHKYLLSSSREAVAYVSSNTGALDVKFPAQPLQISGSKLNNGQYTVDIIKPRRRSTDHGVVRTIKNVQVNAGALTVSLPAFTNDIVVHVY